MFDAHLHIIDPRFPLTPNRGYAPPPFDAGAYLRRVAGLGVTGGAVVSGSFQGFDQTYLRDALKRLGPAFVGVTQLPEDVSDAELDALDAIGVRAVRFNLFRGGSAPLDALESLGRRIHDRVGWHVECYVDSSDLPGLAPRLLKLPKVVIDHLGRAKAGLPTLLSLVERGVKVKASGFSRGDLDIPDTLRKIAAVDPTALLFGTDLPSTRAPRPFADSDVQLVRDALSAADAERCLATNAIELYRPRELPG